VRIVATNLENVFSGMPIFVADKNIEELKSKVQEEVEQVIVENQNNGIIIKADSLGSLEALTTLLRQENIQIVSAGIGPINKKDLIKAETNLKINPEDAIILGFNVEEDEDVKQADKKIIILKNEIIYKLIEDLIKKKKQKQDEIRRERIMQLATVAKIKILKQYVFRNSNPAIFGIRVEAGKIKQHLPLMNENGEQIAHVKAIQENQTQLEEATQGKEIAMSLPGVNFERQLAETEYLYTDMSESQFRQFKENKDLLTHEEIQALQKIAEIKRKANPAWGI